MFALIDERNQHDFCRGYHSGEIDGPRLVQDRGTCWIPPLPEESSHAY